MSELNEAIGDLSRAICGELKEALNGVSIEIYHNLPGIICALRELAAAKRGDDSEVKAGERTTREHRIVSMIPAEAGTFALYQDDVTPGGARRFRRVPVVAWGVIEEYEQSSSDPQRRGHALSQPGPLVIGCSGALEPAWTHNDTFYGVRVGGFVATYDHEGFDSDAEGADSRAPCREAE